MSDVFKALADPSRRKLLDRLHKKDGQTLGELCEHVEMTRFGVMKHLQILEEAHLITPVRVGREKLHYLNPVPIRLIHDRWISKFAEPWVGAMGALKANLESPMTTKKPQHVYEVYIRTTPEKLWAAITQPEFTRQYFYDSSVDSTWKKGAPVAHRREDGTAMLEGKVVEFLPPKKLVTTFAATYSPEGKADRPSRVTWLIEPMGEVCKLTLTHDDFDAETWTFKSVGPGWNPILSGLKTLLETGQALRIPPPAA